MARLWDDLDTREESMTEGKVAMVDGGAVARATCGVLTMSVFTHLERCSLDGHGPMDALLGEQCAN